MPGSFPTQAFVQALPLTWKALPSLPKSYLSLPMLPPHNTCARARTHTHTHTHAHIHACTNTLFYRSLVSGALESQHHLLHTSEFLCMQGPGSVATEA